MKHKSSKKVGQEYLFISGLAAFTVMSGAVLGSATVAAEDSIIDKTNVTVPVSCTLGGTGNTSHSAEIANGTYEDDIGSTVLKVYCNDSEGFAIYAAGYTGDEVGGTDSNKLLGNPSGIGNIVTGTATSGSTSNWAMKLETNTNATYAITLDNGYGAYSAVPNEYVKVAHRSSSTDVGAAATGAELTTTYAAFVSPGQTAGDYAGQVIYTLVHPATHSSPVVCNAHATTISEVRCMQDLNSVSSANRTAIFSSMTPGTQYTMKDKRDGKTYTIAKLADGNVWMTQNLDLDLQAGVTYTNEDTDIGYNTTTGEYGTAAWSPTRSTYSATNSQTHEWCASWTESQYDNCATNDTPESYDPGNLYWNTATSDYTDWNAYFDTCDYSTSTPTCNQSLNPISTYTSSTGTAQYHLGNYYNWAAALATNDSSVYDDEDLVEQSICPAGWTLPRSGTGEDSFYSLWNQYGLANESYIDANNNNQYDTGETALWSSPLYFAASGGFDGVLVGVGGDGVFWSPVASSGARGAGFVVDGYSSPTNDNDRNQGFSIRCVARPVSDSVTDSDGVSD